MRKHLGATPGPIAESPLREIANVRQIEGEPRRRWFTSPELDLIVWLSDQGTLTGFELCYDKLRGEHAIAWNQTRGFTHLAVDDGEQRSGKHKATPLLVADGPFNAPRLHETISRLRSGLPPEVAHMVLRALEGHSSFGD